VLRANLPSKLLPDVIEADYPATPRLHRGPTALLLVCCAACVLAQAGNSATSQQSGTSTSKPQVTPPDTWRLRTARHPNQNLVRRPCKRRNLRSLERQCLAVSPKTACFSLSPFLCAASKTPRIVRSVSFVLRAAFVLSSIA